MATTQSEALAPQQGLCKDDFVLLRSLSRGRWVQGQKIEWRFNREWRFVSFKSVPALCAADRLGVLGLVEQVVCCLECTRVVFQLTDAGRDLAARIDGPKRPSCVDDSPQIEAKVPQSEVWLYRHLPKIWGRWWSARLLATSTCSVWLSAENPEFSNWQRHKRNALCLVLFLAPFKPPLTINVESLS